MTGPAWVRQPSLGCGRYSIFLRGRRGRSSPGGRRQPSRDCDSACDQGTHAFVRVEAGVQEGGCPEGLPGAPCAGGTLRTGPDPLLPQHESPPRPFRRPGCYQGRPWRSSSARTLSAPCSRRCRRRTSADRSLNRSAAVSSPLFFLPPRNLPRSATGCDPARPSRRRPVRRPARTFRARRPSVQRHDNRAEAALCDLHGLYAAGHSELIVLTAEVRGPGPTISGQVRCRRQMLGKASTTRYPITTARGPATSGVTSKRLLCEPSALRRGR